MVEVEIGENYNLGLLIVFASCTAVLVFVHLLSLLIATCLLPDLDALAAIPKAQLARNSAHISRSCCVSFSWFLSHIIGIPLFFIEVIILSYVKFYSVPTAKSASVHNATVPPTETDDSNDMMKIHAGTAATVTIVGLVIVAVPFAICYFRHFYRHRLKLQQRQLDEAEELFRRLQAKSSPVLEESVVSVTSVSLPVELDVRQRNGPVVVTASFTDVDVEKGAGSHQVQRIPCPNAVSRRSTQDNFEDALDQYDVV